MTRVSARPKVYQSLYHPHLGIYETTHRIDGAPWMDHVTIRHETVPAHLDALASRYAAQHPDLQVTDGTVTHHLRSQVTGVRIAEYEASGHFVAQINVAWFSEDGVPVHGECYREIIHEHRPHHAAHRAHLDAIESQIPVRLTPPS